MRSNKAALEEYVHLIHNSCSVDDITGLFYVGQLPKTCVTPETQTLHLTLCSFINSTSALHNLTEYVLYALTAIFTQMDF